MNPEIRRKGPTAFHRQIRDVSRSAALLSQDLQLSRQRNGFLYSPRRCATQTEKLRAARMLLRSDKSLVSRRLYRIWCSPLLRQNKRGMKSKLTPLEPGFPRQSSARCVAPMTTE